MKNLLIGLLAALLTTTASAQVVQPTYVRPSKGAPLVIAQVTATSTAATYTNSALFDWSAFAGVVVTVNMTGLAPTYSSCRYGVRVQSIGGTSTSLSDFFLLNVANNDYRASVSQSWYVRVLPGYLRFSVGLYQADPTGQPSCTYKVTATPLPFDYAGQLTSSGAYSVWYELPGEFTLPTGYAHLRIQNTDTTPVFCYVRSPLGNFNTGTTSAFRLKGESTSGAADGGVIELDGYTGELKCAGGEIIVFGY